jgi:hypothetical protein
MIRYPSLPLLTQLLWCLLLNFVSAEPKPQVLHAFVALCDNASQGIIPVAPKIGNGDDLSNNLYWGCDEAIVPCLQKSADWKKISISTPGGQEVILSRAIFIHKSSGAILVADAYRGKEIRLALRDYFAALAGTLNLELEVQGKSISAGGRAGFIAYVGHDGLMEFPAVVPQRDTARPPVAAVAFSCRSQAFFQKHIESVNATPYILTTQLMYPGGFLLQSAAECWIAGKSGEILKQRVAKGYAKNQGISQKSAEGVFWVPAPTLP